jgi:hypothetical protein
MILAVGRMLTEEWRLYPLNFHIKVLATRKGLPGRNNGKKLSIYLRKEFIISFLWRIRIKYL